MEIDLHTVCDELPAPTESTAAGVPALLPGTVAETAQIQRNHGEVDGQSLWDDDLLSDPVVDTGLPFGMRIDNFTEDTIKVLQQERDASRAEADRYMSSYDELERRICKNAIVDADLLAQVARHLDRLESDNRRCRAEQELLRQKLKNAQSELATLPYEIAGQKSKLNGAGKRVRNAKQVASQQEEKTKTAAHDKQSHVALERRLRQQRNEAAAEVSSLLKLCEGLQADLEVEQSSRPHLRKRESTSDTAIAVMPVELTINRAHFIKLPAVFESNQITITEQLQHWYDNWKSQNKSIPRLSDAKSLSDEIKLQTDANLE